MHRNGTEACFGHSCGVLWCDGHGVTVRECHSVSLPLTVASRCCSAPGYVQRLLQGSIRVYSIDRVFVIAKGWVQLQCSKLKLLEKRGRLTLGKLEALLLFQGK